jgi:NADH:ubiquinone oxidoreductase subunit K
MNLDYLLLLSAALIIIAICGALFRTHIILIASSLNMAISAILLFTAMLSTSSQLETSNSFIGVMLIVLSALSTMIFCGVAIFVYRTRGTLRVDDFRDLRG